MSGYSEDDIRRAADIREWLVKQITDKQEEVERLRTTLTLIDGVLKQGSFRAAANLGSFSGSTATAQVQQERAVPAPPARQQAAPALKSADDRDVRPIKRAKDDFMLANAEVSPTAVIIVPASGIALNLNTPPFRSFFLNRILDGMKNKDAEKVGQGVLKESDALTYRVDDDAGTIKRIVIEKYREKERLQEIFNTSAWVFTRMLEKSGS
ncbi:MAG TPA: hypothetical protein VLA68_05495 [Nitrososphaera sp.]|nr:hypothetical protein [Nitrososphaera sp.]